MENLVAIGALIGFVNIFGMAMDGNWKSFGKAVIAIALGGVFGYLKYFRLPSIEIGILVGLSSSGFCKVFKQPEVGQPEI